MKTARFITEYGNYLKKEIQTNELIRLDKKMEMIEHINKSISACSRGLITVRECMKEITEV